VAADHRDPQAIVVRGITLRGPWGPVYGPVDLEADAGGVSVLVCPAGLGRTALLMTLAGRMKPRTGSLTVLGQDAAPAIFARSALAGIDELDGIAEWITVRDAVGEELRWAAPWYRAVPRAGSRELELLCAAVFGPLPMPPLDAYVDGLPELDQLLLRIALANTKRPPLLVVANLDRVTDDRHRELLVARLVELGRAQTVITASANGVSPESGVRAQIRVENVGPAEFAAGGQKGAS
jgi:hypothetical protein